MTYFFLLAINKLFDLSRVVKWVVVECALLHNDTGMPCPFKGHKMFCAGQNFLSQPKNLIAFSASSKPFVLGWHKLFVTATICK